MMRLWSSLTYEGQGIGRFADQPANTLSVHPLRW
jgi:hypothetical protein